MSCEINTFTKLQTSIKATYNLRKPPQTSLGPNTTKDSRFGTFQQGLKLKIYQSPTKKNHFFVKKRLRKHVIQKERAVRVDGGRLELNGRREDPLQRFICGKFKLKYNILVNFTIIAMKGHFKLKTKLSWSPNKNKSGIYMVKASLSKKPVHLAPLELNDKNNENKRPTSLSAQKIKANADKLFRNAHVIESTETYVFGDYKHRECNTNSSSSPNSPKDIISTVPKIMVSSDKTKSRSNSCFREISKKNQGKDIRRTVEIAYKGQTQKVPVEMHLMTTLSKIILGDDKSHDDFYLQILGESSIHGDQDNYIDFGETDIFGDGRSPEPPNSKVF